jgi:hypothetical protein
MKKKVFFDQKTAAEKQIDINSIIDRYLVNVKITDEMVAEATLKGLIDVSLASRINNLMVDLYFDARLELMKLKAKPEHYAKIGELWKMPVPKQTDVIVFYS